MIYVLPFKIFTEVARDITLSDQRCFVSTADSWHQVNAKGSNNT